MLNYIKRFSFSNIVSVCRFISVKPPNSGNNLRRSLMIDALKMKHSKGSKVPDDKWQPSFIVFDTNMGSFTVELFWKHAPQTCKNFAELSRRGYYNNTIFHRIIPDFMIQGGDPTGTGTGGKSIYGGTFKDEIHPDLKHINAGILSMANCGPNTNGSQFFITLAPAKWLDGKHAIFGRIHTGMNVVKEMGKTETNQNDKPVEEVKILRAKILKS